MGQRACRSPCNQGFKIELNRMPYLFVHIMRKIFEFKLNKNSFIYDYTSYPATKKIWWKDKIVIYWLINDQKIDKPYIFYNLVNHFIILEPEVFKYSRDYSRFIPCLTKKSKPLHNTLSNLCSRRNFYLDNLPKYKFSTKSK